MALNKENKNYYYNLGRVVAIVEIMQNLDCTFMSKVFNNAFEKLPYHLTKALFNEKHNLHNELLDPAHVVHNGGEFPKGILTAYDKTGVYAIGYYHQKSYLQGKYNGVYGKVETIIEHHAPEKIELNAGGDLTGTRIVDNAIDDLKR